MSTIHCQYHICWWSSDAKSLVISSNGIDIYLTEHYRFRRRKVTFLNHYNEVIMSAMSSLITGVSVVYSIVYLGADQRKHQGSAPLAFVRGFPSQMASHAEHLMMSSRWELFRSFYALKCNWCQIDVILCVCMYNAWLTLAFYFPFC